ncbi:TolC family protein [Tundrisphaera lichenicola]|uniref:TolC family protein n=1 Tax=Tundrisphaera lichenicola TaxID=2029860 RepID=UPI003EBFAF5C
MIREKLTIIVSGFAVVLASAGWTQDPFGGGQSPSSRADFPFGTRTDRLSGPPRTVGDLPEGQGQPPSTLPGRLSGNPPTAMGEAPPSQGGLSPVGPTLPQVTPSESSPRAPYLFMPSPFSIPVFPRILPRNRPMSDGPGELPPALPGADPSAPIVPEVVRPVGPPLGLGEVLASAERAYPPFLAIQQERGVALGDNITARGAFDLNLNADSRNYPLGFYNRSVQDVFLDQALMNSGGKIFGGYRIAQGNWPTYYNYLNTRSGGAFVAGLEQPLLKNREIDAKRAKLLQTEIERRKVEPTILKQRISLLKDVAKAYANWLAAGRSAEIYRDLVRVANLRKEGLEQQAREGIVRAIDLVDFRKILLAREQQEIQARRRFEQTSIDLSLYLRDERGFPILPDAARLPSDPPTIPPPDPTRFEEDIQVALRLRPEILSVRLTVQKAQVERRFAENQLQPSLSLYIYAEQNVGNRALDLGKDFRPFVMESSLLFDVPLQRRAAKGRVVATDAVLRQLAAQGQFAVDEIRADVLDAQSGLRAAQELLDRARQNEIVSRRLEDAERILLREGSSTVLFLNLREQSVSDAQVYRIEAEAKALSALAEYRAALGLDAAEPTKAP